MPVALILTDRIASEKAMNNQNDKAPHAILEQKSPLENFYVTRIGGPGAGLIHFFDEQGREWLYPINDEDLNCRCIDYLRSNGAPFITSSEDLKRFRESREGEG